MTEDPYSGRYRKAYKQLSAETSNRNKSQRDTGNVWRVPDLSKKADATSRNQMPTKAKKRTLHQEVQNPKKPSTMNKEIHKRSQKGKLLNRIKIVYTNELTELATLEMPHMIAVCEVKPMNGAQRIIQNYSLDDYVTHHTNADTGKGRGSFLSTIQYPTLSFR